MQYNEVHGKEIRSTTGSSMLSIFEILKDQIQDEQALDVVASINNRDAKQTNGIKVVAPRDFSDVGMETVIAPESDNDVYELEVLNPKEPHLQRMPKPMARATPSQTP